MSENCQNDKFLAIFSKFKIMNIDFIVIHLIYKIKKTLKITQILSFQTPPKLDFLQYL